MLKSLSLAGKNWKVLVKSLICQVLVLAMVIALGVLLFGHFIEDAFGILSDAGVKEFASETITSIMNGTFDSKTFTADLSLLIDKLQHSIASIENFFHSVELTYVALVLMLCIYRLLVALPDVAAACQLEEYMTSLSERPFMWFYFKKQGRSWKFVLLQFAWAFPLDVLLATGCIGFYLLFLIAFNWWTIIPVAVLLIVLYSLRLTLFAFCLPSVACEDMSCGKAFKNGISKLIGSFWKVAWKTLIVVTVIVALSLVSLLYVENAILMVIISAVPNFILFFVLKCINMVEYFNATERAYFSKSVLVEGTEKYNKREERRLKKLAKKEAKNGQ